MTFDYELFYGGRTGTPENCLFRPVKALLEVLERHGVKAVFFVDAGYLVKLRELGERHPRLRDEYDAVANHVLGLCEQGHDVQLHVHPHWEDALYDATEWRLDLKRYRLHEFSNDEIGDIVARYRRALTELVGDRVFAFRAGGWCLQPFDRLARALRENGVWLDSTVFRGGYNNSLSHYYDFRGAPDVTTWFFDEDPLRPQPHGRFLEVPIASFRVGPLFFWRFAVAKKLGGGRHRSFGDGTALRAGGKLDLIRMLLFGAHTVVSADGYKAGLLARAFERQSRRAGSDDFVVIGHPKAFTRYSLECLDRFVNQSVGGSHFTTFRDCRSEGGLSLPFGLIQ